uniref:Uncharacterized protein n=1 Tax=Mustela putorius furo TaxID=9669 RepID=M3Z259_MUSPF
MRSEEESKETGMTVLSADRSSPAPPARSPHPASRLPRSRRWGHEASHRTLLPQANLNRTIWMEKCTQDQAGSQKGGLSHQRTPQSGPGDRNNGSSFLEHQKR